MSNAFDKEILIDTLYTLLIKVGVSDKDYRIWFKTNENKGISVITPSTGVRN